jgi:hypothetical protein
MAPTPWIPAFAGMTQPIRNPTDWQCIYEMDIKNNGNADSWAVRWQAG